LLFDNELLWSFCLFLAKAYFRPKVQNMFSTGQIVFALLFAISFIIIVFFSYKKDRNLHAKNYKGVKWVVILFLTFIVLLFFIKHFLKN